MKIKNINRLLSRLNEVTDSVKISDEGCTPIDVRYDAYEELVLISEDDGVKEIKLTVAEAKKLRTVLNSML